MAGRRGIGGCRRRRALLTACVVPAILGSTSTAGAAPIQDANCPGPRTSGHATSPDGRFAQTFTPSISGTLTSAQVDVTKNAGSADWIMQVVAVNASGVPTNTVLAQATVPDASVPMEDSVLITATFATPAPVLAGQSYALVLTRPGSGAGTLQVGGRPGDLCAGDLFSSNTQSGPFDSVGSFDMVFAVFIEPAPEQPPDTDPPETTITNGPPYKIEKSKVRFKFRSNEPGSTFECKKDKKSWKPCTSPARMKRLDEGRHKFKVRATDPAGNTDPTPAKARFKVKT